MAGNDPRDLELLSELVHPVPFEELRFALLRWLQDGHEAAGRAQLVRVDEHLDWRNDTSFGTDRYQYLVGTADAFVARYEEMTADHSYGSLLIRLPRAVIYPFRVESGPHGSVRNTSDLRFELLSESDRNELALLKRREILLGGRELLLLPWEGTEKSGLTGAWIGQGLLAGSQIDWTWLVRLDSESTGYAGQPETSPFDAPQPVPPLRPRTGASSEEQAG